MNTFEIIDNYFYGWLKNSEDGYSGVFWETDSLNSLKPKVIYNGVTDIPSEFENDGVLLNNNWVVNEFIRWTKENEMGFCSIDGTWTFKIDKFKNAYIYNNLNVLGDITAQTFTGDGFKLNNLNASSLQGVIGNNNLPDLIHSDISGTAEFAKNLKSDSTISIVGGVSGKFKFTGLDQEVLLLVNDDSHKHDERYFSKTEISDKFLSKTDTAKNSEKLGDKTPEEYVLKTEIQKYENKLNDILNLSSDDLNSFYEIVSLINDKSKTIYSKIEDLDLNVQNEIKELLNSQSELEEIIKEEYLRAITEEEKLLSLIELNKANIFLKFDENNKKLKESFDQITDQINELNSHVSATELKIEDNINDFKSTLTSINNKYDELNLKIDMQKTELNQLLTELKNNLDIRESNIFKNITTEQTRAEEKEKELEENINIQASRINDILNLSTDDKNSFKEIVDLINSVDLENDDNLINYKINTDKNISDLKDKDSDLQNQIDDLNDCCLKTNAIISSEIQKILKTENDLVLKINDYILLNDTTIENNKTEIENKLTDLKTSISLLDAKIILKLNDEINRSKAAEELLTERLTTEEGLARKNEFELQEAIQENNNIIKNQIVEYQTFKQVIEDRLITIETHIIENSDNIVKLENQFSEQLDNYLTTVNSTIDNLKLIIDNNKLDCEKSITECENNTDTLRNELNTERLRIDEILNLSEEDKNSFREIVDLINSVDLVNDQAFGNFVSKTTESISNLNNNLDNEIQRATTKEDELENELVNEIRRATNKEDELNTNVLTIGDLLKNEISERINEDQLRYLKSETDTKFLFKNETAINSNKLNNEDAEHFKEAYLKAVGEISKTSVYKIYKEILPIYWDDDRKINFSILSYTPMGSIIDLTINTKTENITINDLINQADKRIDFLPDDNRKSDTIIVSYLIQEYIN